MSFIVRSFFSKGTKIFMDYAYWKPFQIIDFFRDRLTELSFSCFIAYSGENYEAVKQFNEWHKNAIYATMFLANPSILFSTFGDYFFYDPVIRNFVKGNKYLWGVLETIMQLKKEGKELTEMQSILTFLSSMPPLSFIANILADILKRPINFYTEWVENIYNFIVKANYDFVSACSEILSEFNKALSETVVYALKPQVVVLICPWIYYLFPTIISHIRLNYAYSLVEPKKERPTLKGSIFKYLLAELYFDNKYIESNPVLSTGDVIFTMPKEEFNKLYPREITIDVMGLRTKYFVKPLEFPRFVIDARETPVIIPLIQSDRVKIEKKDEQWIYLVEHWTDWNFKDYMITVESYDNDTWIMKVYIGPVGPATNDYIKYDENILLHWQGRGPSDFDHVLTLYINKKTKDLIRWERI
ncbi:MAG: hypothetical protein QXO33_04145 [Nitrososphaeria archaeon]